MSEILDCCSPSLNHKPVQVSELESSDVWCVVLSSQSPPGGCGDAALAFSSCLCPHRKSLDLVESLLRLSEVGQYEQVKQLFGFPIKHCPDMLVLALLQISTSWHTLRHELISTLMPIFLGNHPNSAIILHYAWHGQVSPAPGLPFS